MTPQRKIALVHLDAETLADDLAAALGGRARAAVLLRQTLAVLEAGES